MNLDSNIRHEFYVNCINGLYSKFGKMSINDFLHSEYDRPYPDLYSSEKITYALCGTPLVYSGTTFNEKPIATALYFKSTLKDFSDTFAIDIRYFVDKYYDIDGNLRKSDGIVNRHLFDFIDNSGGYVSLKDFIFEAIDYIGHKEVYFIEEEVRVFDKELGETSIWIIHCELK